MILPSWITRRAKAILSIFALYISVTGLVTFSLFMLEESVQMATFGTWPAQEARDWETVRFGCERIKEANRTLKIINYSLGWIQPLAFLGYRSYGESTDVYIRGLEAKIFANAPELFDGETISFTFTPQSTARGDEGFIHKNGRITFISSNDYSKIGKKRLKGTVSVEGEKITIREAQ